jgi:hypothetical protein
MRKSVEKRKTTKAQATSSLLLQRQHESGKLSRRGSCSVFYMMRTSVENWEVIVVVVGGGGCIFLTFLVFCFRLDALVEWLSHSGLAAVLPLCAFFLSDERAQDEVGEQ